MPDTISNYRQVRLIIGPSDSSDRAYYSLHATTVRNGVPHAVVLDDGFVYWDQDRQALQMIIDGLFECTDTIDRHIGVE